MPARTLRTLLAAAAITVSLLPPDVALAQCDPRGVRGPRFLTAAAYAERVLSAAAIDATPSAHGSLPSEDEAGEIAPWRPWPDAAIRRHCGRAAARGDMSAPVCVTYARHQNAVATLVTLTAQLAAAPTRAADRSQDCARHLPRGPRQVLRGAPADRLWACLGGVRVPGADLRITTTDGVITQLDVRTRVLAGTPGLHLRAARLDHGCGHRAWSLQQVAPLDWPADGTGIELATGDEARWTLPPARRSTP